MSSDSLQRCKLCCARNAVGMVYQLIVMHGPMQGVDDCFTIGSKPGGRVCYRGCLQEGPGFRRWDVRDARVIHRVGRLALSDQIVFVGVCSAHRGDAFAACSFIMDALKTSAPFWKKEMTSDGEHWVEPSEDA